MKVRTTKTYELPVPSGVKVAYTEGTKGISITNGLNSIWVELDHIPVLAEALKAIRYTKAAEEADRPSGMTDD